MNNGPGAAARGVRSAILAATLDVLVDTGYEGMSIDLVAARAGVHKTTVYRRWPTKSALVAAAAVADAQRATGSRPRHRIARR